MGVASESGLSREAASPPGEVRRIEGECDDVAIVIVSFRTKELLRRCLDAVRANGGSTVREVVVVDNASGDGSSEMVTREYPWVTLIASDKNEGFSRANNRGIGVTTGRYVLLLNSDAFVHPNAIDQLRATLVRHPVWAVAGARVLNEDGTLQRSWYRFPRPWKTFLGILGVNAIAYRWQKRFSRESVVGRSISRLGWDAAEIPSEGQYDYLAFSCVMLRREALEAIGPLNESLGLYHEDCDYGFRLRRRNKRMTIVPEAVVTHVGGGSSEQIAPWAFFHYCRSLLLVFKENQGKWAAARMRLALGLSLSVRASYEVLFGVSTFALASVYKKDGRRRGRARAPRASVWKVYRQVLRLVLVPDPEKERYSDPALSEE